MTKREMENKIAEIKRRLAVEELTYFEKRNLEADLCALRMELLMENLGM